MSNSRRQRRQAACRRRRKRSTGLTMRAVLPFWGRAIVAPSGASRTAVGNERRHQHSPLPSTCTLPRRPQPGRANSLSLAPCPAPTHTGGHTAAGPAWGRGRTCPAPCTAPRWAARRCRGAPPSCRAPQSRRQTTSRAPAGMAGDGRGSRASHVRFCTRAPAGRLALLRTKFNTAQRRRSAGAKQKTQRGRGPHRPVQLVPLQPQLRQLGQRRGVAPRGRQRSRVHALAQVEQHKVGGGQLGGQRPCGGRRQRVGAAGHSTSPGRVLPCLANPHTAHVFFS